MTDLAGRYADLPLEVLEQLESREDMGYTVKAAIRQAREARERFAPPLKRPSRDEREESEIRQEIKRWCMARGAAMVIDNEQNRKTRVTEGLSDLIVLWGDERQIWFVEVKAATGKQSMAQLRFQVAVEASGGTYILARGIEDLQRARGE